MTGKKKGGGICFSGSTNFLSLPPNARRETSVVANLSRRSFSEGGRLWPDKLPYLQTLPKKVGRTLRVSRFPRIGKIFTTEATETRRVSNGWKELISLLRPARTSPVFGILANHSAEQTVAKIRNQMDVTVVVLILVAATLSTVASIAIQLSEQQKSLKRIEQLLQILIEKK
ncbi:MAG: hypothetical protein PHP93_07395 [Kiritimatiellales bacterium]|nr:hypothetical protein [Kiritimatiellales bacterium]